MAIQDQNGVTRLQGGLSEGNGVSLSPDVHSVTHIQQQDQFSSGNSNALKVRKAYTISKQREKWTDDEHKKFLEALKLYGRAWPRIEEHVGTKTAVQIRSHAQKFFSKVTRDSSGSNTSLVESIEIPPPRPKRKPMHPYPRKLAETRKKRVSNAEQPSRPCSLKSSHFDQENISPKSVLSGDVSETLGSSDSDTPTQSLSPLSSINGVHTSVFSLVEPSFEEHGSPPPTGLNTGLAHDEQPLEKLELLHNESVSTKDVAAEESSGYTLKLFGTTLFVTDTSRPPSPSVEACKPIPALYYTQLQSENSDTAEGLSPIVPWWSISLNRPSMPLHKEHEGKHIDSNLMDFEDKEVQKEGSSTGSNSNSNNSSVHDGENNESSGDQAKSHVHCFNKVDELLNLLGHTTAQSEISAISKLRVRPNTSRKGFVPYKRCMAERENHNLLVTGEEMDMQQIRLSL